MGLGDQEMHVLRIIAAYTHPDVEFFIGRQTIKYLQTIQTALERGHPPIFRKEAESNDEYGNYTKISKNLQKGEYVECKKLSEINPNINEVGKTSLKTEHFCITQKGINAIS
jgi:hypothetical protein